MDEFHFYADPDRGWAWQVPAARDPRRPVRAACRRRSATPAASRPTCRRRTGRRGGGPLRHPARAPRLRVPPHAAARDDRGARSPPTRPRSTSSTSPRPPPSPRPRRSPQRRSPPGPSGRPIAEAIAGLPLRPRVRPDAVAAGPPRHRRPPRRHAAPATAGWSSAWPRPASCGSSPAPTPSASGSTCRCAPWCFTGLAKYDGTTTRLLSAREFHQIAGPGRAGRLRHRRPGGRPGPRARDRQRAGRRQGGRRRQEDAQAGQAKPPKGYVAWTEDTFDRSWPPRPSR